MIYLGISRSHFPARIALLGSALSLVIAFSGCNNNATGDFAKHQQIQENAISVLTELGAKFKKADTGAVKGWSVDLSQVRFTPVIADKLHILGSSLSVLNLSNTALDDSQLADLIDRKVVAAVMELDISHNPAITDQSVDKLAPLLLLSELNLVGTQVTEAAMTRLREQRQAKIGAMGKSSYAEMIKSLNIRH